MVTASLPHAVLPPRLNEIDYLMVVKDQLFREATRRGNVCFLALALESQLEASTLSILLENSSVWRSLAVLRLSYNILGYPCWIVSSPRDSKHTAVVEHSAAFEALPQFVASRDIDPIREPPLELSLIQHEGRSTILFGWHHALLDAHRAEALLHTLLCSNPDAKRKGSRKVSTPLPLVKSLKSADKARKFILKASKPPLCTLPLPVSSLPKAAAALNAPRFTFLRFTKEETAKITENTQRLGLELFPSCFLLAAVACAFQNCALKKGAATAPLLVPVPHDSRRGHSVERQASNDLSIFFFRIEPATLSSVSDVASSLLQQAEYFVKEDLHRGVPLFLGFSRALPPQWYRKLLASASGGAYASFYFSDIGESLSKFQTLSDEVSASCTCVKILDAVHFPPLFYPPGICFVASRRNGCLMITIVSAPEILSELEVGGLAANIRGRLCNSETTSS
jgi:hypothetical protein